MKALLTLITTCFFLNINPIIGQTNSLVGLTIKSFAPSGFASSVDGAFLVKLEDNADSLDIEEIIKSKRHVIKSNFYKNKQIYFVGLEAGRYTIVSYEDEVEREEGWFMYRGFFSADLIRKCEFVVGSNEFKYLGEYVVKSKNMRRKTENDKIQVHFFEIITGKQIRKQSFGLQLFGLSGEIIYKSSFKDFIQSEKLETKFYQRAKKHFAAKKWRGTNWLELINSSE